MYWRASRKQSEPTKAATPEEQSQLIAKTLFTKPLAGKKPKKELTPAERSRMVAQTLFPKAMESAKSNNGRGR